MSNQETTYDLIVVGSGPAGVQAALHAAKLGKKVALIEKHPERLGGAWIHTGTL
ncbi:MAG: FAD-dependent oxidoreductase, partial [Proteobacteria bacterium]